MFHTSYKMLLQECIYWMYTKICSPIYINGFNSVYNFLLDHNFIACSMLIFHYPTCMVKFNQQRLEEKTVDTFNVSLVQPGL